MTTQVLNNISFKNHSECFLISLSQSPSQMYAIGEFLTIGRDSTNQLLLLDPFVSGRHARIENKSGTYVLKDLRSRNGTFINGVSVLEAILRTGDQIRFGEREFIFQNHCNESVDHPLLKSKNESWALQLQSVPVFAKSELPVLLLGPSGGGKEVLARLIHQFSTRNQSPFVSVNCSALSESLVESELFGHVRGSFTGAANDRKGAFEEARGGTLFLDEIGDLPLPLQPKLLRALENKEIRPVGVDKSVSTDVRIIAATHQNLHHKIQQGAFRADLYFRLHVIKIFIPALIDRIEDFEDLLYNFGKDLHVRFSFEAVEELKKHSWPGNIRELKNTVARASALFSGTRVEFEHLDRLVDKAIKTQPAVDLYRNQLPFIKELEREMIKQRLIANRGNQRKTAVDLNIPKSTLHDRIRAYGIEVSEIINDTTLTGV